MNYPIAMQAAVLAAVLRAGSALAQTMPAESAPATPGKPGAVVTDVGPAPAEERNSTGAIVLENSLVRAQRENGFARASAHTGVASIGRGVLRATLKAQKQAETAQARQDDAADFYRHGAGTLQVR
ncbi:MAG: hypothetical protein ACXWJM_07770 [Ramlibacter sp.]